MGSYFSLYGCASYSLKSEYTGIRYVFKKDRPVYVANDDDVLIFRRMRDLFLEMDENGNPKSIARYMKKDTGPLSYQRFQRTITNVSFPSLRVLERVLSPSCLNEIKQALQQNNPALYKQVDIERQSKPDVREQGKSEQEDSKVSLKKMRGVDKKTREAMSVISDQSDDVKQDKLKSRDSVDKVQDVVVNNDEQNVGRKGRRQRTKRKERSNKRSKK